MHLTVILHAVYMTIISVILTHQMVLSWKPIKNKFAGSEISHGLWRSSVQNHKSEAHYMESYVDLCDLDPCRNAGECLTVHDGFLCRCPPGWSGKVCQQSDTQSVHYIAKRNARAGTCTVDPVDVVFVVDSTGSIGSAGFQNELDFIKDFTNLVIIGRDAFHIGVVQFGNDTLRATIEFDLVQYSDKSGIISAIQSIRYQFGGIDYIDVGLQLAKDVLDQTARSNAVKYVVLLTDGGSRDETATLAIARTLNSYSSLRLYVIGIGLGAPTPHLQQIASDTSYFLHVDQPAELAAIVNSAVSKTCQDIKDCASSPCQNGATCVTTANGYTCTCHHGFEGVRCQTDINECEYTPCQHGDCTNTAGSYACDCQIGWRGKDCSDVQLELILPLIMLPLALLALLIAILLVKIRMRRMNREKPFGFHVEGWTHGSLGVSHPAPPMTSSIFNKSLPPGYQ